MKPGRLFLFETALLLMIGWVLVWSLRMLFAPDSLAIYLLLLPFAALALKRKAAGPYMQYLLTVLMAVAAIAVLLPVMGVSYSYIVGNLSPLLTASVMTLYISMLSVLAACIMSFLAAMAKLSRRPVLSGIADVYISFFRGTPLLLQVFIIYLGLPQVGIVLSAIPAAVLALGLNYGAYMAEVVRAGIQGVPRGQTEASISLGLKGSQTFALVVMPQALRLIIPPVFNQFIAMLKDSSLVSFLGVWELMFVARTAGRTDFRQFEMLIGAALIYWLMSFCFEMMQRRLEAGFGRSADRMSSSFTLRN